MLTKKTPTPAKGNYRLIPLNKRMFAKVDPEDYDWLIQWRWRNRRSGHCFYTTRRVKKNGKETIIKMHRQIMKTPKGMECHHINHNPLDNRKANLLNVTPDQHKEIHRMG